MNSLKFCVGDEMIICSYEFMSYLSNFRNDAKYKYFFMLKVTSLFKIFCRIEITERGNFMS